MAKAAKDWDLPDVPPVEDLEGGPVPPSLQLSKEQQDRLHELGRWIQEQELPETADSDLVKFIHSCDYDLEKAKKCAKDFYWGRSNVPEMFSGWDHSLPNMRSINEVAIIAILPRRTPDNFRIIVSALRTPDTTNYVVGDVCRAMLMVMETLFLTEPTCEGIVAVHDLAMVSFSHFLKVAWNMPRKLNAYMQDGLPLKRERVHLVNCSGFVDSGLRLLRHVGRKEDWDRMCVHRGNDFTELHKHIPVDCLPSNFGGTLPCLEQLHENTIQRMEAFKEIFRRRGLV